MAITPLPSPPLITDSPDVFDTKASAHVASLSTFVAEMNAAIAAVNMTKWISGTTYAIGDVTWSPITFYAYRRKTAGAGTTDPSADATNWIGIASAAAGANADITSMTALTAPTAAANPVRATDLQSQTLTAFTTGGTSTAFTLTPSPAIGALAANQRFRITFNAAAGATPTLAVSGLTAKNLKYKDSTGAKQAITSAQVPSGWVSDVEYDGTDWVVLNHLSSVGMTIQGAFKNLQASSTGLSANVSVTADEIVVENSSNAYQTLRSVSLTIAGTSSGVANGLDTGTIAASTWYSVWVIWNGTTTAGLLSTSATAPTLPSGYTHYARVGWMRTDASGNKYPMSFIQMGRSVNYKVVAATNVTAFPIMSSGTVSNVAVAWANFAPPTIAKINVLVFGGLNSNCSVGSSASGVAEAAGYGAGSASASNSMFTASLIPQSANIYWSASAPSSGTSTLSIIGWEDNL